MSSKEMKNPSEHPKEMKNPPPPPPHTHTHTANVLAETNTMHLMYI